MDLQVLRFFVTVAQEGGFTAASEKLHYAQSNLSTRIRQMEEELGETLFYRNKRGVTLTAKGELFYEYANRILNMSEEAMTAMRDMDHARGSLTIGSIEATALGDLPSLFAEYHRDYPDVKLSLTTDMNDVFVDKVLNREIDGAFVAESPERKELNELFIRKDKLVFVTSIQEESSDIWELLKTAPVITFPEGSIFRRRLELLLASHGIISFAFADDRSQFSWRTNGQHHFGPRRRIPSGVHHRAICGTGSYEKTYIRRCRSVLRIEYYFYLSQGPHYGCSVPLLFGESRGGWQVKQKEPPDNLQRHPYS